MSHIGWRLVEVASRALEPDERDAVGGDLAESGETAGQALGSVLSLVVRRQAELWKDWRSWLVLTLLIIPLGTLLAIASRIAAGQNATYMWLYLNNWDWSLLRYAEFWYELRDSVALLFVRCLSLACWSWTAGFVLGFVSRRLILANTFLFCFVLLVGEVVVAPRFLAYFVRVIQPPYQNDPITTLAFYRSAFPVLVQIVLVAAPCIWAMRQGAGLGSLPPLRRTAVWVAAVVTLLELLIRQPGVGFLLGTYRHPEFWRQVRVFQFIAYWPAVYLLGKTIGQRWHRIHI